MVGVDWMGDVLFSTPLLRALRKAYPDSHIAYSTAPRCAALLDGNPSVNEVISYDEPAFLAGLVPNSRFWSRIRAGKFDTAIFLHRSASRAFLAAIAGVRRRIGFATPKQRWLLTDALERPAGIHRAEIYAAVLRPLGLAPDDAGVEMFVSEEDRAGLAATLKGTRLEKGGAYAVLHLGGNWDLKRWPIRYFADVAAHLASKGIVSVICGTEGEEGLARELEEKAPSGSTLSLCGKTRIKTLAALFEKAELLVSNDSGPIHVAAAVGAPIVGIYGPTSPEETGPLSRGPVRIIHRRVGCRVPCYFDSCHHRVCLDDTRPPEVIHAIDELLRGKGA